MTSIAIMQPYFLPYAGYFRLFYDVDCFIALDSVQYSNRGWINRNRLISVNGTPEWFTAPFARAPLGTRIDSVRLHSDAEMEIQRRMQRFPACTAPSQAAMPIVELIRFPKGNAADYVIVILRRTLAALSLDVPLVRASTLPIDEALTGVERIYAICRHLGASIYYNASGGTILYDRDEFAKRGIELRLHPPYRGPTLSILQRLHDTHPRDLRAEIEANLK